MEYNITLREVYDSLISSEMVPSIYKEVEKSEIIEGNWAFHNYTHVLNVMKIAQKILSDLGFDDATIYKCKIACLLHDVGVLQGKEGHAKRSYQYAINLFKNKGWVFEGMEEVLFAIRDHSSGFDSDNMITLAIILADKLDIKKSRVSNRGKEIVGHRQFLHIEDVDIDIEKEKLKINFITDGKLNLKELNEYYFTKKVFKAVEAFSKKVDLKYDILLDDKNWILTR